MGLTAGILGLPNVGKTTLFNALTKLDAPTSAFPYTTQESNIGAVEVPDERLDRIVEIVKPRNVVRTSFQFTDVAGLAEGASHGEGLGNQFLAHIREVDAICHVVRCFKDDNVAHVNGAIDPVGDIEVVNLELAFADLDVIAKRIEKIEKKAKMKVDHESVAEYEALTLIKQALEDGKMARTVKLTDEQASLVRNFSFLTMKPMIYVLNVSEDDIANADKLVSEVKAAIGEDNKVVAISAKIEEELSKLSDEDKEMFLADLGISETSLNLLVKETYDLLGLQTFFTAGEKECRSWTFKKGMKAPQCAGVIHSDFERGFIKAEVVAYDDFIKYGSLQKVKEAGKFRLEGKDYVFQDGDMTIFRFNL